MKYWNKDRDIRRRCWARVVRARGATPDSEVKRWCQQQSSTGKFYFYYGTDTWWFERSEDAVLFTLRWA
jgi:hypothetical protein